MNKDYLKGYEDATETLELAVEMAAKTITGKEVNNKDLTQIVDRFISTVYLMKFSHAQMQDEYLDGACTDDCSSCKSSNIEDTFNDWMNMLKEEI